MNQEKTTFAAKGKWRGVLMRLGIDKNLLTNKHTACPMCGGSDRFRFDNKEGKGTWICNQCGAGDGIELAKLFTGKGFAEVAREIDGILGNVKEDDGPVNTGISEEKRVQLLRDLWGKTRPMVPGDLADRYLASRGVNEPVSYPKSLRFSDGLPDGCGGIHPCMVAIIGVYGEKPVSMHRTFIRPDGLAKAEIADPRQFMPGSLPDGACIALSEYAGGPLGIAEGIETALAASRLYELPVWSALNTSIMAKWFPPEGCDEVVIFADRDPNFAGEKAAYTLANRLACKGIDVTVKVPEIVGWDFADVLINGGHRESYNCGKQVNS